MKISKVTLKEVKFIWTLFGKLYRLEVESVSSETIVPFVQRCAGRTLVAFIFITTTNNLQSRADIEYTLHEGLYPRFYIDELPHEVIQSPLYQTVDQNELLNLLDSSHVFDPELRFIIADLMNICRFFNVDRKYFQLLEPYAFQEIWISLSYRLLHHCPLKGGRPESASENAWQFSILAFITTFLFQKGRSLRLSYGLLAGSLRTAIDYTLTNDSIAESTMLWFLFMGGISVLESPDTIWLSSKIKTSLANLGIDNWLAARDEIKKHPWIDVIHDKLGKELWYSTFGE